MVNKTLLITIIGLLVFTIIYSTIVFNSNFGMPNTMHYQYNYPCDVGYNKYEGGFVFKNCYVLDLNPRDNK